MRANSWSKLVFSFDLHQLSTGKSPVLIKQKPSQGKPWFESKMEDLLPRRLEEYLSTLTDEELRSASATIELDDIEGIKLNILNIIKSEMKYRIDNKSKCKIKR